jgi:hypothetical protein
MTPKELTLLVIAEAEQRGLQPVQLQKAIFLIGQNLSGNDLKTKRFYVFSPYDFGPFCRDIYEDAESLEKEGAVTIRRPPETPFKLYYSTEVGKKRALDIKRKLSSKATDYIKRVVEFTQRLTFNQLVSSVYKAYPKMKAHSVFQE